MDIHKYAQSCPVTSQMKLLIPEKIGFKGPEPLPVEWLPGYVDPQTILSPENT